MNWKDFNEFLDRSNTQLEECLATAALTAHACGAQEESLLLTKRTLSYNPECKRVLNLYPVLRPIIKQIEEIVDLHGQQIKVDPEKRRSWQILGHGYLSLGDFMNAFAAYGHAIRLEEKPSNPNFLYAIGIVYQHYHFYENALNYFSILESIEPKFKYRSDVVFRQGLLFRNLNRYVLSIQKLESLTTMEPPSNLKLDDIRFQLAYSYQIQGSQDQARAIYVKLLRVHPMNLELNQQFLWFNYLASETEEQFKDLLKIIQDKLRLFNQDPTILLIGARTCMRLNDMTRAYQYYRECISYWSDSPQFWCGLGILYCKNDQMQDAVVAFQRAIYLRRDLPEAWLNLGYMFERQNDINSAMKIYQTGLQSCTDNGELNSRNQYLSNYKPNSPLRSIQLIDISDSTFLTQIPEDFVNRYLTAIPELPEECFEVARSTSQYFKELSTYPKSLF